MFDSLSERLTGALRDLRGKGRLSDADIDTTCREIRLALLEADVSLLVVRAFVARIKERAKGAEVSGALNPAQQVIKIVNEELIAILGGETRRLSLAKQQPSVIMLAGLQGSGKTSLAGKLARWLRSQGHTPLLVAADLQRPNAVTQLQIVGQRAGATTFAPHPGVVSTGEPATGEPLGEPTHPGASATGQPPHPGALATGQSTHPGALATGQSTQAGYGVGDPVEVARQGVEYARARQHDIVVIDTAGRLGVDAELMAQASAIRAATDPDEVLFVVDAMIGQDAVATAEAFRDGVGFTGVVLTKLDGDARGGAALSVREVTGQPILFVSTGEKLEDFDVFHPDRMASRILGMGDVLSLIEQAEQVFDAEQAEQNAGKIASGDLTLEDFLDQMLAIRRMGPIGNLLGMLPGANAGQLKDALAQIDDRQLDRVQAIIRGMTPAERADPKIINGSRRLRIAKGSGVSVSEVNDVVARFFDARKMMKQMAGQMGFGSRRAAKNRKGKKGAKGRARSGQGRPRGMPALPDLSRLPPGLNELPPGLAGLDQLPPGFDPSKFKLPKSR